MSVIPSRDRDLGGGFMVRRVLPHPRHRRVGPWVFLDHFGPVVAPPGRAGDVRPHPHCALSTVSYLFEGSIEHRDSTGGHAVVGPGEIHWMRAGHGIVHSERTPDPTVSRRMHGLQLWCAHPDGAEEQAPRFDSWTDLPELDVDGARVQLLAGTGWGEASPVEVTSPLVYAIAHLAEGQAVALPDHPERCAYVVSGAVAIDGEAADRHQMLVVEPGAGPIVARSASVVAILGGDPIGRRHMWWNLVHSDPERLREQAQRWRDRGFPVIPGDDDEFIEAPPGP